MKKLVATFSLALVLVLLGVSVGLADTSTVAAASSSTAAAALDPSAAGPDAIVAAVSFMAKAFKNRNWLLVAAALLTVLIVLARMLGLLKKVKDAWVPWLTMGMAAATSIVLGLQSGRSWNSIATTGVLVGVAAIGGWESFGKLIRTLIMKLKGSAAPAAPAAPAEPPAAPPGG